MRIALIAALAALSLGAEILDRTVAIVGADSILDSEVEAEARLAAMFGDQPLDTSESARAAALERLIDQRLLANQIALSGFEAGADQELEPQIAELSAQTFAGLSFEAALQRYGVTAEQARDFLRRQLRFADYVSFRFRSGLEATPQDLQAEYRRRFANRDNAPPFDAVADELAENVRIRAAEAALEDSIRRLRATTRIVRLPLLEVAPTP
jgi:parvulin-like peptidyl-prolyl isomerase